MGYSPFSYVYTYTFTLYCNISTQVALEAARTLDDKACWERLGDAALAQGNHLVRREGGINNNNRATPWESDRSITSSGRGMWHGLI